jgi:hypothetical protein
VPKPVAVAIIAPTMIPTTAILPAVARLLIAFLLFRSAEINDGGHRVHAITARWFRRRTKTAFQDRPG